MADEPIRVVGSGLIRMPDGTVLDHDDIARHFSWVFP